MKIPVMLSIRGRQTYLDQEPDVIELVTEGTLEYVDGGWNICYEETELTGLQGVNTLFRVEPDKILLSRTGRLNSQMIFQKDVRHDSLYQMEFGALMITVCANWISVNLDETGGVVDLIYGIEIEQSTAGEVDYHLTIVPK
ncbi:MAG: DUF1934 domain-containing protein [Oscillospiraceae bacterium]|nr:DUF1934 domain-containing protein [Oscillospiraceae bacterium]